MRARRSPSDTNTIDRKQARAQLAMLLCNASDEKFESFTVEMLSAVNRTPKGTIQSMLYEEQRRRAARAQRTA